MTFRPLINRNTQSETEARWQENEMERMLASRFNAPNLKNRKLMEQLKGVSPAYAKHAMTRNDLLKAFAFKVGGGVDLLKQPVCERCELPCTWGTYDYKEDLLTKDRLATCECGHVSRNPMTVEQYLMEYVKGVDERLLDAVRPKLNEIIQLIDKETLEEAAKELTK